MKTGDLHPILLRPAGWRDQRSRAGMFDSYSGFLPFPEAVK